MNSTKKPPFEVKMSPLLRDLPEVPRRKSKELRPEHKKMNVITKKLDNQRSSPKSPLKTPLKSPGSALNSPGSALKNLSKPLKPGKHTLKTTDDEDNDLKTEELGNNYVMEEKEINIMRFLEEENIVMANPKEKQFEYFESAKKQAFMIFAAVDRSKSESKRFSLDSSTLLNKRRASLPRLVKDGLSGTGSDNDSSPDVHSAPKEPQGGNMAFGFMKGSSGGEKKSKFNLIKTNDRHFCSMSPINNESRKIRDALLQEEKNNKESNAPNSSESSRKSSSDSEGESNISSEEKLS